MLASSSLVGLTILVASLGFVVGAIAAYTLWGLDHVQLHSTEHEISVLRSRIKSMELSTDQQHPTGEDQHRVDSQNE